MSKKLEKFLSYMGILAIILLIIGVMILIIGMVNALG
jgi:hypothetical protein